MKVAAAQVWYDAVQTIQLYSYAHWYLSTMTVH